MTESRAEIALSGPVPDALASLLVKGEEQEEAKHYPNKRRRLSKKHSTVIKPNSSSGTTLPDGYIPLARFTLDLNFADTGSPPELSSSDYIDLPYHLPVRTSISTRKAIYRPGSHDPWWLKLQTTPEKRTIFTDAFSDPDIVDFFERMYVSGWLVSVDNHHSLPIVCYQSTLHCLSDRKSFQLETTILWKDSLEMLDRMSGTVEHSMSKFVPQAEPDAPLNFQLHRPKLHSSECSPREFYDNVHVPEDTSSSSAEIKCDLIRCQLHPFQRRAVRWLLQREGVELDPDGQVVPIEKTQNDDLPASFVKIKDVNGRVCFASCLYSAVTTDLSRWYDASKQLKGGILAEEMGLGKTVEMISLICLNRWRPPTEKERPSVKGGGLRESGATLIITPPAILDQWKQEIESHAAGLRVLHYTGFQQYQDLSNEELIDMIAGHDIVLTTYNILSREVHFAEDAPQRNLRHERKFERKKTPLVQMLWWRVCLDEAQMVESGVSNAAKTARLILRQNAWAVTGTPLRRDMSDLFGLLVFLHYVPICNSNRLWDRLCGCFKPVLANIINTIALRHNKDHVRNELRLPPQKRVVITVPFTAVEEQHYGELFDQMCEECGFDATGSPLKPDWDPNDPVTVEKMRSWLTRLRQTCLHPEVSPSNRRALGAKNNPLRSVAEVLEVMIDQNETQIRAEERSLLLSQLRRGQLLENAMRHQEALDLWKSALQHASAIVQECRNQLESEREKYRTTVAGVDRDAAAIDPSTNVDGEDVDKNTCIGTYRQKLRVALEVQHICIFFTGNAYYQVKTNPKLTAPDSEEFRDLEKREVEAYEAAKQIRKEILAEVSEKVGRYMKTIKQKVQKKALVHIPKMKPSLYSRGVEAQRLLDRFEDLCTAMNEHSAQYNKWRDVMTKLLLQSLIDQEEDEELKGDEYEKSTKHQDEMYVYMEALRAMYADRSDALTGQKNTLIDHEVKGGIMLAQKGEGPSPKLFLTVMDTRSQLKPDPELGSLRGIINELRGLATTLEWQESGGSTRARTELEIVNVVLRNASHMAAEQAKVLSNLEREVEVFRDTMNSRLEYYRQLQQISDTVAPYDEESVGKPLNEALFTKMVQDEAGIDTKISALRAKRRYLIHLREDRESDKGSSLCVICQSNFEIGVLTVCGHKYCKDCLLLWWRQHRSCPSCKTRLKATDFHQITYKPQELVVQEEKPVAKFGPGRHSKNSVYTDISSGILSEIKNIDLDGSFGTKIDTLSRHILWLRQHDPGAKSIVFSQYKGFLGVLGSAFSRFKIGYTSVDNKDGIEKFKSDPALECFLLHAKAHSSGLNLVNATHVFLCEPLINTAIELQATARVHRIGQQRPTTVWMYLVSGTVEESIYDISVSRRLAHIAKAKAAKGKDAHLSASDGDQGATIENLTEAAIDSANSLEMQDATRLMAGGASGGELVNKDDLWQCLFGNVDRREKSGQSRKEAQQEVGRFLRGEAAEGRRAAAANNSS